MNRKAEITNTIDFIDDLSERHKNDCISVSELVEHVDALASAYWDAIHVLGRVWDESRQMNIFDNKLQLDIEQTIMDAPDTITTEHNSLPTPEEVEAILQAL